MNLRFAPLSACRLLGLFFITWGVATSCSENRASTRIAPGDNGVGNISSPCVDADGDGFGVGCDTGRDCNDHDSSVTTDCVLADCNQTSTAPGCDCSVQGAVIDCGEVHQQFGDVNICGYGRQTCDAGQWSGCRINSLPGRLRQALTAPSKCPTNPCDPYCKEFLEAPNYTSTPTGTLECTIEGSCQDGIQNQAEVGIDCEGPCAKACGTLASLISETFASSAGGFTYADDTFRGTNAAASASGSIGAGRADITLGSVAMSSPNSGGVSKTFPSGVPVTVSFDWRLAMGIDFQSDECSDILVSIDGVLYGEGSDDFVVRQCGSGATSGSFSFTSNTLSAGDHTLTLGGYLNKNDSPAASVRYNVVDYTDYRNPGASGGNDAGRGGDDGFEASSDTGGGLNVKQLSAGDYIEWTYDAAIAGDYAVNLRVANNGAWNQDLLIDGSSVETLIGASTGGDQNWKSITSGTFSLTAGAHTIRLRSGAVNPNIAYLDLILPSGGPEASVRIDNVLVTSPSAGVCGDAACTATETCGTCPSDCGACPLSNYCGDATCDATETCGNCASDCGACLLACGDGVCGTEEACGTCETDCGVCTAVSFCGDATCDVGESCSTCASDCGACECGDATCDTDETCSSCAADCGQCASAPSCGDATCDAGEDCASCQSDCGTCVVATCGDGTCGSGETQTTCPIDCGAASRCGDGVCDGSVPENSGNCETDCGVNTGPVDELYLETECATTATGAYASPLFSGGTWYIRSDDNRTSTPPTSLTNTSSNLDRVRFDVQLAANADYDIHFRINPHSDANDDSWFYRVHGINGNNWTLENGKSGLGSSFKWSRGANGFSTTSAGTYTLEIANREDDLYIDQIAVIRTDASPSATAPAENDGPGAAINCGYCGDSIAQTGETCSNCAIDVGTCTPFCGDAICDGSTETCSNCDKDCGSCVVAGCGDGTCDAGSGEDCSSCATDCNACTPTAACGDAICNGTENCSLCETDCGSCPAAATCGDGSCNNGEDCSSCAIDCGACTPGSSCGDGTCDSNENCATCATDCGACADRIACGDTVCNDTESCSNCATDCGSCTPAASCGDGTCNAGESCATCAIDCGVCAASVCSNDVCESDENCSSCSSDCGDCMDICPIAEPPAALCPNGTCDATSGEHCGNCPADCGGACAVLTACGNGSCEPSSGEDCDTCPADCSSCSAPRICGDGLCEPSIGETCASCSSDCGACQATQNNTCGDATCEPGETCDTCQADCGACAFDSSFSPFNTGMIATGTVFMGNNATVTGDVVGTSLEIQARSPGSPLAVTGDLNVTGSIQLNSNVQIGGDIRAGGVVTQQTGNAYDSLTQNTTVTLPTLPGITASPGSTNLDVYGGQSYPFDADVLASFNRVNVYANATIRFVAGRYDFQTFGIEPNANIYIDTTNGPVEWRINGNMAFKSFVSFTFSNPAEPEKFGVFANGNIDIQTDVDFPSALYAPNGDVSISDRSTVRGGIAAINIRIGVDAVVGQGTINAGWTDPVEIIPTPAAPVCGDNDCTPEVVSNPESCLTCSQDCGDCDVLPSCGDNICQADTESCTSCEEDCGSCVVTGNCGDGTCDSNEGESCTGCEADCGPCVPTTNCGDELCTVGEDCSTCALDCGLCPAFTQTVFSDEFEITEACNDAQEPLWAGLSWDADTPGDSRVNIYFRSANSLANLDSAPEVLVAVAASSADNGGFRYGPPAQHGAMEQGFQYLNDMNIEEELPHHNKFGRLRFEIVPTTDGQQTANLLSVSLQTSCETVQ